MTGHQQQLRCYVCVSHGRWYGIVSLGLALTALEITISDLQSCVLAALFAGSCAGFVPYGNSSGGVSYDGRALAAVSAAAGSVCPGAKYSHIRLSSLPASPSVSVGRRERPGMDAAAACLPRSCPAPPGRSTSGDLLRTGRPSWDRPEVRRVHGDQPVTAEMSVVTGYDLRALAERRRSLGLKATVH